MNRITFHILDIQSRDVSDDDRQKELVIHLFGVTNDGHRIRCDVTGFQPSIYLRLPEQRTSESAEAIKEYIRMQHIPMNEITIHRIMKKIFYGFTANTSYPFLQLDVTSLAMFRKLRGLFLTDSLRPSFKNPVDKKMIEVYEANIDPMLRFLHVQNIQPCGWVSCPCPKHVMHRDKNSIIIIESEYDDVIPTAAPSVSAPFLTASWDIECFSQTGDFPVPVKTWKKTAEELVTYAKTGAEVKELLLKHLSYREDIIVDKKQITPIYCKLTKSRAILEKKLDTLCTAFEEHLHDCEGMESVLDKLTMIELEGDPVIQIGTTIYRSSFVERHLFVFPDCAPIDGIVVHALASEKEMIAAWFNWMVEMDPDILIGYNVFGFDETYLWKRAEVLGIIHANSPVHQLSRLRECGQEVKLEEKMLSSSAMGDNQLYIWSLHGRLQIDMFHYIKRNNTLGSYKLDEVTKHFMSGTLKSSEYADGILTLVVGGAVQDVRPGRSIMLLDDTGETVTEKLIVASIEGNTIRIECTEDDLVELNDACKWVIVKDDVSPADIFRLHRGSAEDRAVIGKYCLQDCDLVIELYKKLETFNNCMSMANVCTVPITYIFVRGQGIKIESLIFKFCREKGILIPVLEQSSGSDESYEGAIVLDPEPGFYSTSPIGVCDFASLYPSTIVSENISHDSLLWVKDFTDAGNLIAHQWGSEVYDNCDGYAYTDIEYDIIRPDPADTRKNPAKIKCGRRICRYAQPLDGSKSTLPQITTWLLQARSAKKKEMKQEKNPERYALLDAEQLAYKLTGNSLYGQLGSGTFKIRLQALAASVTAYGRKQILFAKDAIEKFYGPGIHAHCAAKVVYGDTDSLFVEFNPRNPETGARLEGREARQATIDITDEAGHFITKVLAAPHDFEFDKAFDPMLLFSKKRYAGNMYENNADDYVHKYMGIALKRRDNAPIVKTIFGGAMKMLLDKRDVAGAFQFVKEKCLDLVDGKVSLTQLTVTKSLRASYANPEQIAHKVLADRITMRDPGNAPASGDRIGYVYIRPKAGQVAAALQGDRIETPPFIKEHGLEPDYRHYIEHQLQNPISQAFGILLEHIPGFHPSWTKSCPPVEELDRYLAFREAKAADVLFADSLRRFNTIAKHAAFSSMFSKGKIITTPATIKPSINVVTSATATIANKTQKKMSNYMLDSFIVTTIKKKEKAVAAEKAITVEKEKESLLKE
jgi:DNA polymerase elongation subunit (family B)